MNWSSWLLWGFLATIVLTTISATTQGLGLTRMNFPYMLGSIFTPDRDRARFYGFWVHVAAGEVSLNGKQLSEGDAAAVNNESVLELSAAKPSQVLLFDLN